MHLIHVARLQKKQVGLGIGIPGLRCLAEQSDFQLRHDLAGDLILDGEDIVERAVISLRPKMIAILGLDQLDGDPQAVA